MKEIDLIESRKGNWKSILKEIEDLSCFLDELEITVDVNFDKDSESSEEINLALRLYQDLELRFLEFERLTLFDGKFDAMGALISFYSGAGGDDAQDWNQILLRMYLRYIEEKGWKKTILQESRGSEAGIKSITIEVKGLFAYGHLSAEAGVHRLVRLSPFNSDNLRQTSFAALEVVPLLDKLSFESIVIDPSHLKIDTFRSSGAGGQSVNTTDSAVRITHLPTGLVASCQNERSQLQNKQKSMEILKAKIAKRLEQEQKEKVDQLKGDHQEVAWGNQIRSYVMHPYKLVKDHRTGFESSDIDLILSGKIEEFIDSYLRFKNKSEK